MTPTRLMVAMFCATGCLGLAVLAQSQERKGLTISEIKQRYNERFEQLSAPVEQHQQLAVFVGDFDQTVEMEYGAGEPMRSHCLSSGKWIMGGRYVQIESAPAPDEELKGSRLIIYGYDKRSKKFTMWTIDSGSTFATSAAGDFDAETKTFTFEGERYGNGTEKVPFRWVVRLQGDGSFGQEIQVKSRTGDQFMAMVKVQNTPKK